MQQHLLWLFFVSYFTFFNICDTRGPIDKGLPYFLSRVDENDAKPPIILYLKPRQYIRTIEDHQDLKDIPYEEETGYQIDENNLRISQNDERAYILYHLLRTSVSEDRIEPTEIERLEHTKEFLRKAFNGRCQKLNSCVKECPNTSSVSKCPVCPKPKKVACTNQCKQTFDDLDACYQPKKNMCGKKCSNTMPPSWLL